MTAFTLAHLSDPHLPLLAGLRLRDYANKRALGYFNWSRNRHATHRLEVLDALVDDIQAQTPDHIACTGDLVNLALESEFPPALEWLQGVGPPDQVSVVPGNHDAYMRSTRHRFAEVFRDFISSDEPAPNAAAFPYLRRRGPVALIGVSTGVPSPPLRATGLLGIAQLAALDQMLQELEGEAAFRVLLIHHPLRSASRHKRLIDSPALLAVLKRRGVDLILHGHDHIHSTMWFDGPDRPIPSIGVPSASSVAHGRRPAAAYNLFSIARSGNDWQCEQVVRGVLDSDTIGEVSRATLR
jgi:3',5'-cyclic AMP phosphodiesterase CpdA